MAVNSSIEWTDNTWNPLVGSKGHPFCIKVSPGCDNCYAERIGLSGGGGPFQMGVDTLVIHEDQLNKPSTWKKGKKVFVCSMTDLFLASPGTISKVWDVMLANPQHTYQILTKRPKVAEYMTRTNRITWPDNIWLGVTAENMDTAEERIPILMRIPAKKIFVSCEPLLGPINLEGALGEYTDPNGNIVVDPLNEYGMRGLDWVIVGGESGKYARPMHPRWVMSIRDLCVDTYTPFFFKQWGEYAPDGYQKNLLAEDGITKEIPPDVHITYPNFAIFGDGLCMNRVGRAKAGNLLEGETWLQFPKQKSDTQNLLFTSIM